MTLILNALTPDYVVQVSDRRLTRPDGTIFEDDRNKAVLLLNHTVFGYTGTAALVPAPNSRLAAHPVQYRPPGFPNFVYTDDWLTDVLAVASGSGQRLDQVLDAVRSQASAAIRRSNLPNPRLQIMGIGATRFAAPPADVTSVSWSIRNYDPASGNLLGGGGESFAASGQTLDQSARFVIIPSDRLPDQVAVRTQRTLDKALQRGAGARAVARLLAATVRAVAAGRPGVGKNLLGIAIPLQAVRDAEAGQGFIIDASEPQPDRATFVYSPENGPTEVQKGMNWIGPNGNAFFGMTIKGVANVIRVK
jgi:hypothetical protein